MSEIPLAESLRAKAKAAADKGSRKKMGLIEWGKKYVPHYFKKPFSRVHIEIAARLDEIAVIRDCYEEVIMPRGYAKSTITGFLNSLKAICEGTERYILLGSSTAEMAQKYFSSIVSELEGNALIRQDYPLACQKGACWNATRIETGNDVCVEVFGKSTGIRGAKFKEHRPSLVVLDDPQSDDDVTSPTTAAADIEWFNRTLLLIGDNGTNFLVIGNNIHQSSIIAYCKTKPNFNVVEYQAIEKWPTNMKLWNDWEEKYLGCGGTKDIKEKMVKECEQFYLDNKAAMDEGAQVLWPDKESLYDLMIERAGLGHAAFEAEKQSNPHDPSKCEFNEEWFDPKKVMYDLLPAGIPCVRVGASDPSKGGKVNRRRDYSPIISGYYYPDHRCCYLEVHMTKIAATNLASNIVDIHRHTRFDAFGIETNGFQQLIGEELETLLLDESMLLNIIQLENYGVNKNTRISRLSHWFRRGFFKFKNGCADTRILLEQIKLHPFAVHDDGPDCLEMLIRVLTMICDLYNAEVTVEEDDGLGDNLCDAFM